ncbi:ABC transporter ATP-binding protein [Nanchangia anserum]|uniref:ABC transporter ATP-binding protein n=1 Tax=Nanchangia anserum TaxID=2692125 RepID=A0A8I0KV79_9ACTO|nr:ABC transporter ATP-binding protein [Nanchangia anserum]MBD3688659.1 ABC transporter ATP-binding protein [Nanchangia anserum]QOX82414.1 ABC transporter ATP-binding protein [Nanchangia anserum]
MESLVELDDVSVVRGGNPLLSHVTWQAESGQHWVIFGPNGAGKTTLVSMLAARLFPTEGAVSILGEELGNVETQEIHERVGFCSSALLKTIDPSVCVRDIVLSAAYGTLVKIHYQSYEQVDEARADWLMKNFGISHLAQRHFATLSDGERQRVLICRALMADPEILILDEPAAGVDLGAREILMGALAELASAPTSPMMIMVTHHVEEIPPGFTHALMLKDGRIVTSGELEDVLTSKNLSETFSMYLRAGRHDDQRWWAHG